MYHFTFVIRLLESLKTIGLYTLNQYMDDDYYADKEFWEITLRIADWTRDYTNDLGTEMLSQETLSLTAKEDKYLENANSILLLRRSNDNIWRKIKDVCNWRLGLTEKPSPLEDWEIEEFIPKYSPETKEN